VPASFSHFHSQLRQMPRLRNRLGYSFSPAVREFLPWPYNHFCDPRLSRARSILRDLKQKPKACCTPDMACHIVWPSNAACPFMIRLKNGWLPHLRKRNKPHLSSFRHLKNRQMPDNASSRDTCLNAFHRLIRRPFPFVSRRSRPSEPRTRAFSFAGTGPSCAPFHEYHQASEHRRSAPCCQTRGSSQP
jgi:hypothetical protein